MNKEFCTYEQALALKELGFNEQCMAHLIGFGEGTKENGKYKINQQQVFYPNDYISSDDKAEELGLYPFGICGVPLYQQAFRWFREKHGLEVVVQQANDYTWYKFSIYQKSNFYTSEGWKVLKSQGLEYKTYEEAESDCLDKLIEICKNK
jgi:hypothetical protein